MEAGGASSHCPHLEQVYDHLGKRGREEGRKNYFKCASKLRVKERGEGGVPKLRVKERGEGGVPKLGVKREEREVCLS